MKSPGLIFIVSVLVALFLAPKAYSRPDETELKSDLELELEGKSTKKKPQIEAAPKRSKSSGISYKSMPSNSVRQPMPEMPAPPPMPVAAPSAPVAAPVDTPPVVNEVPSVVPAPPAPVAAPKATFEPVKRAAPSTANLETILEQAQKQYDQKHYDRVADLLRPINDRLPRSGLLLLARAYAALNDTLNELRTLELCIAKNPKDYVVQTVYGQALVRAKRIEDAFAAFSAARELNPRYRPAYEAQLKQLEIKGERYEARNVVNDMIKTFGPEPKFYTDLCRLYWLDAYHEKVVELCQTATEKEPHVAENFVYLGLSLIDREEIERSHRVLTGAARRFPASEAVQSAMGELYLTKKDYVSAYNYYKRAVSADAKSARAWVGYGVTSFELQKNDESLSAFTKGCALDKTMTKEFRSAIGKLRVRKDTIWQSKFEMGISGCL